ncbi:MAG: 2-C-methyl-D-erythritol 4-phosphate cytidylyltransferase [Actinomycetota bacterium]|nr:2-C-methyl-D-erythritol 4-phosphate cytidylyltransferase [Actinomycetota bacterium]
MRAVAVLLGAGRGDRLGLGVPKAFARVAGRSLLAAAGAAAESCADVHGVIMVVPPGREPEARAAVELATKLVAVVAGGDSRQDSVRAALAVVPSEFDAVVCHDVARPLARPSLYSEVLAALDGADAAVPVVPVPDTVKRVRDGHVEATVDRGGMVLAQTPQAFRRPVLDEAHRRAVAEGWKATDDAGLAERAGFRVAAVAGDPRNVKITTQEDLALVEVLVEATGG